MTKKEFTNVKIWEKIYFQSFVSIVIAWKIIRYHTCTNFDEFPIDITDAPSENQT
jgi:hypothetical protein